MIKGSEVRKADHEIEPFLLDRWSARAMSGEGISREELMRLFEAARWDPHHPTRSNSALFMHVEARNIGRRSSTCSSTLQRRFNIPMSHNRNVDSECSRLKIPLGLTLARVANCLV